MLLQITLILLPVCGALALFTYYIYRRLLVGFQRQLEAQRIESGQLLQIISHDLRSPLQILQSYLQLLEKAPADKLPQYTGSMLRAVERMTLILNRMRDYQGVLTGKKQLHLEKTDLQSVFNEALLQVEEQVIQKNIKVRPDFQNISTVLSDAGALLDQVLMNFLSNAVKFTPKDGTIDCRLYQRNQSVYLEIQDHGIGMPVKIQEEMFHFNKTSHRLGTEGEKGTGFGVPIASLFLEKMKIQLEVNSKDQADYPEDSGTLVRLIFSAAP